MRNLFIFYLVVFRILPQIKYTLNMIKIERRFQEKADYTFFDTEVVTLAIENIAIYCINIGVHFLTKFDFDSWVPSTACRTLFLHTLLAHRSRRLIGELIGYSWSGVRPSSVVRPSVRSQCSKIFFSKTAWPIKAKFYVEHPWVGGTKVCSWHLVHMTKMADTPIYGKNHQKSSSPEPAGRFPRNLVCSIGDSSPS